MTLRNSSLLIVRVFGLAILVAACQPSSEERLGRAEALFAESDFRAASIELQNLLKVTPDNGAARLLLAQCSYQLGDFSGAVGQFEKAIGLGETGADTWVAFGRTLLSQGRAVEAFERVVPNLGETNADPELHVFLGDVHFALADRVNARRHYDSAVEIDPASVRGLIGLAMLASAEGDNFAAQHILNEAEAAGSDQGSVHLARGRFHQANRENEAAADAFAKALALGTLGTPVAEHFATRINLVTALIDSRQLERAASELDALASKFPAHPVSIYLRGRLAFATGDYDSAQLMLQDYLATNPGDGRGQALLGLINFSQENLRQAEAYLIAAVRANAGGESTRRLLAETRLRLNNPEGALDILNVAGQVSDADAVLLAMMGRAELATGDTEAAIKYFRRGLSQDPDNEQITLSLASTYLKGELVDEAIELLDAMPMKVGSQLRRQTLLISALLNRGDSERAIEEGEKLLAANPDDATAYAVSGALWQSLGDDDKAESLFIRALELEPNNLAAQFSLSRILLLRGDIDGAVARLESLLDTHVAYVPALVSLGMLYQQRGTLEGLRVYIDRAMTAAPDVEALRILAARMQLALGRPDTVLEIIDAAKSEGFSEPELDHLSGLAWLAKGDNHRGLSSLMDAAAGAPTNAAYQFDLAQAQLLNKFLQSADETARVFCDLMPQDQRCPVLLGEVAIASGDAGEAVSFFEMAAETRWNRVVATGLARAYSLANKPAREPLLRWLEEHPDDHGVRLMYARILEREGDIDAAMIEYERLHAGGRLDAVGMNNLAWQYFVRDDVRAVTLAEMAHALEPDNGNITDTLGWILAKRGELKRAIPLLREAADKEPASAEIRFHLASALATYGDSTEARQIIEELLNSKEPFPDRDEAEQVLSNL